MAWGDRYDITAEVRIGPGRDAQAEQMLKALRRKGSWLNAKPCDPLKLALLIVNEHYRRDPLRGPWRIAIKAPGHAGWIFDQVPACPPRRFSAFARFRAWYSPTPVFQP